MNKRIGFLFLGPVTHIHHAASIAFELASRPGYEVTALVSCDLNADTVNSLAERYGSPCRTEYLHPGRLHRFARKFKKRLHPRVKNVIEHNARRLQEFDALVMTNGYRLAPSPKAPRPRLILTGHGAGLRAHGSYPEMAQFDLFLLPGQTKLNRLQAMGYLDERKSRVIGYPKFDLVPSEAARDRPLFANDRPVVLYNPHFNPADSSWPIWGEAVLDYFLAHPEFNLIFAPHMLLFGNQRLPLAKKYLSAPNIHVDVDSPALIDMSYSRRADIYLGDVSSQVYEFVALRPRPCLFLNPRRFDWQANANLEMWRMGVVLEDLARLGSALHSANEAFADFRPVQEDLATTTISMAALPAGQRGAQAIADLLEH